jgi:hypothetical protein
MWYGGVILCNVAWFCYDKANSDGYGYMRNWSTSLKNFRFGILEFSTSRI